MENKAKIRIDSWDAALTDAQRWCIFDKARRSPIQEVAAWIAAEYKIEPPCRSSFYRFLDRMRKAESGHRLEQAIIARNEAGELAKSAKQNDDEMIEAYKALASDAALRTGDAKGAIAYTKIALALAAANAKKIELELKTKGVEQKEESNRLAREKFEYDAAKRVLEAAKQIKSIQEDKRLDNDAKILAIRQRLFGEVPNA